MEEVASLVKWVGSIGTRRKQQPRSEPWTVGKDVVIFTANPSLFYRLSSNTQPRVGEHPYIPKPKRDRIIAVGATTALAVLISLGAFVAQRKVIRSIAFRTDQPQFAVDGRDHASRLLRAGHGRRMVILESLSGRQTELPIEECVLYNTKAQDRLSIKVPDQLPFLVDVENAELGWPGVTKVIGKFEKDSGSTENEKAQRALRDHRAKELMTLLWQIHSGTNGKSS
ncbi:hypothetical protein FRC17_009785 [Serendipita sp. 399]|nr:hypothetical protein FRC17_009785 [Serendipita sp. 399]